MILDYVISSPNPLKQDSCLGLLAGKIVLKSIQKNFCERETQTTVLADLDLPVESKGNTKELEAAQEGIQSMNDAEERIDGSKNENETVECEQ